MRHQEWKGLLSDPGMPSKEALESARALFGEENVRFYGAGIPNVLLDGNTVTDAAVDRLLSWSED